MTINANFTNAVTNALHASCLFTYFLLALIHYIKKDTAPSATYYQNCPHPMFSWKTVFFFFILFTLKVLGIYVHYYPAESAALTKPWIMISFLVLLMNYTIAYSMYMPTLFRVIIMISSLFFTYFFIVTDSFLYIALSIIISNTIAAYVSVGLLKLAWILIIISNVAWIGMRNWIEYYIGHPLPQNLRYDNDVYHLMLIGSTYILYLACVKGYWRHPNELP